MRPIPAPIIDRLQACREAALRRDEETSRAVAPGVRSALDIAVVALIPVALVMAVGLGNALHPSEGTVVAAASPQAELPPVQAPAVPSAVPTASIEVSLTEQYGTFAVPVTINGVITLDFTVDSGATDIAIPADVLTTLERAGTISKQDFRGSRSYQLADGATLEQQVIILRSMKVGDIELRDLTASVAPAEGALLLGQSFFTKLDSWSIDNGRKMLVLKPRAPAITAGQLAGSAAASAGSAALDVEPLDLGL